MATAIARSSLQPKRLEFHGMARRTEPSLELTPVSPRKAAALQKSGAVFVDIREAYEHNARRIEGSQSAPLTALPMKLADTSVPVVFYCQTGTRTVEAADKLKAIASSGSFQIAGGLDAWMQAGLPVTGGEKGDLVGADLLKRLLNSIGKANQ